MSMAFTVDFWNVGQGDCSSITRPDNSLDVIDTGPRKTPQLCDYLSLKPRTINALVITHNDADHIGGVLALLNIQDVIIRKAYLLFDGHDFRNSRIFNKLIEVLGENNIFRLESPLTIDEFNEYKLVVRFPNLVRNAKARNANDTSAIIGLTWNDKDVIVWGADNKIAIIRENIVEKPPMLFGPHHGAPADASNETFARDISMLSPRQCFLSYGTKNNYNHPNKAYIKALRKENCRIICSQRCRHCGLTNKRTILDGDGFYNLLPPKTGLACHGHVRLKVQNGEVHDELELEYEKAKIKARKRLCI